MVRGRGKIVGSLRPMLQVEFKDPDSGMEDVVVFSVWDTQGWKEAIEAAVDGFKNNKPMLFG